MATLRPKYLLYGYMEPLRPKYLLYGYMEPFGSVKFIVNTPFSSSIALKRPSPLWFWRPNSIIVVYMDPLGKRKNALVVTHIYGTKGTLKGDLQGAAKDS